MADLYALAISALGGFIWGVWPELRHRHDARRRDADRRARIAEQHRRSVVHTADGVVHIQWRED